MIQYRIIKTKQDVDLVVSVVSRMYTEAGYIDSSKEVDLVTHTYLEREDAATFLALPEGLDSALGTISVITDINEKLPMDVVYGDKLSEFRKQGLRLAEVRRFAVDAEAILEFNKISETEVEETDININLLGIALKYAIKQKCDLVCFMIKREHSVFYESLTCTQVGEERPCPAINNKPVVGYVLDLREINSTSKSNFLLKRVLSTELPDAFFD